MRTEVEIKQAHDTLEAMVKVLQRVGMTGATLHEFRLLLSVLCWVLGHDGGMSMEAMLLFMGEIMQVKD